MRICLPMQGTWVWFLGGEDSLGKGMAIHSSVVAWETPWGEEFVRLPSMGLQKSRTECSDQTATNSTTALSGLWLTLPLWRLQTDTHPDVCPAPPKTPLLGPGSELLRTFRHIWIWFHATNGIWGFNIFYALYLPFTVSSVGKFLPMSSNEYKKGFVHVYLFFYLPVGRGRWAVLFPYN